MVVLTGESRKDGIKSGHRSSFAVGYGGQAGIIKGQWEITGPFPMRSISYGKCLKPEPGSYIINKQV